MTKQHDRYTIRQVTMNPELAKQLLSQNTKNRVLRPQRVAEYSRLMGSGRWDTNNPSGCSSQVDEDGILIDSQHRLHAIIAAGWSGPWVLFEHVHQSARATCDVGRSRTPGDFIHLRYGIAGANRAAAITRVLCAIDKREGDLDPVREDLGSTFETYRSNIEYVIGLRGHKELNGIVRGVLVWALQHARRQPEKVHTFVEQVCTGERCDRNSVRLRELTGGGGNNAYRWQLTIQALRIIDAEMRGRTLSRTPTAAYDREGETMRASIRSFIERLQGAL
jgi:hypothetical protein